MDIRKTILSVEEIVSDGGPHLPLPIRRATAVAVVKNPFAGRYVEDLSPLFDIGLELGTVLMKRLVDLLGGAPFPQQLQHLQFAHAERRFGTARGLPAPSIARMTGVSIRTVHRRLARLRDQLEVETTAQLAAERLKRMPR